MAAIIIRIMQMMLYRYFRPKGCWNDCQIIKSTLIMKDEQYLKFVLVKKNAHLNTNQRKKNIFKISVVELSQIVLKIMKLVHDCSY